MTNTEKTTTTPIRRAGLALTAGLAALLTLSACTGGSSADGPTGQTAERAQGSTTAATTTTTVEKLSVESARAGKYSSSEAPEARLEVVGRISLSGQPGLVSERVYLTQPNEKTVRAYWNGKTDSDGARPETWVDLTIGDDGKALVQKGQARSEKVALGDNVAGEPATSGARKGVPNQASGEKSGVFFFAAGTPGEVARKAPMSQKQDYRDVLSAVEQGDYVYLTVEGFPGVLIAELEKTQG